ncbi:MAG: radical SAM family heme chaperone HemW [Bdellovibrionaceae bacterium]|nr:radical SAM family heme chaperone HemW [Pseudobdellovibrionaceae bacterium]
MSFGIYVHIPYCIQRCTYCDFATYEQFKIMPPQKYVELLFEEIRQKKNYYAPRPLDTLYFGGGTPSLIPSELIVAIIQELANHGYTTGPQTEITIEINPATVDEKKLAMYLSAGVNRFSVGAQTFEDRLLKMVHREHNSQQTLDTLALLRKYNLNFSFDILFALPSQTVDGLKRDVDIAIEQGAKHISPYCLTVPEGHPLSKGRPVEDDQIEMFEVLANRLNENDFRQYEISNFSLPGFESRHNILYWADEEYWGLGLSAHSYSKATEWGLRYWNPTTIHDYEKQVRLFEGQSFHSPQGHLAETQFETLAKHQSLTDYCHTSLRMLKGLDPEKLTTKFSTATAGKVLQILERLKTHNWLQINDKGHWFLTPEGLLISNQIFAQLTFLGDEI